MTLKIHLYVPRKAEYQKEKEKKRKKEQNYWENIENIPEKERREEGEGRWNQRL